MSLIPGIKGLVHIDQTEDEIGADLGIQALLTETEKLLESWKHPDPYTPPTAPGGEFWQRQPADASDLIHGADTNPQVPSTSETFHHPFSTVSFYPADPNRMHPGN
jgi:NADH dehydrogenase (ubiquinone) 1 beta subcomplex subunit 9